jgi:hypothetical protein
MYGATIHIFLFLYFVVCSANWLGIDDCSQRLTHIASQRVPQMVARECHLDVGCKVIIG